DRLQLRRQRTVALAAQREPEARRSHGRPAAAGPRAMSAGGGRRETEGAEAGRRPARRDAGLCRRGVAAGVTDLRGMETRPGGPEPVALPAGGPGGVAERRADAGPGAAW